MGTVSDLITEIQSVGGFDVTSTDALTVLDRRHKLMCRRARAHRMRRTIAVTTGASATYSSLPMPLDVVEVFQIEATGDDGVIAYQRTVAADRSAILDGSLCVSLRHGVFLEDDEDDATDTGPDTSLILYPALTDASNATVRGAFTPPTLTTAETGGAFIRVPVDFHEGLLAGVYASLLSRPGESRPDLEAGQEAKFSQACGEFRDWTDRRYRTRGPRQIRQPLQGR